MADLLIALLGLYALASTQEYGQMPAPTPPPAPAPAPQATPAAERKAGPAVIATLPTVPGRGIRDVPNIAIKYYDVSGKDFAQIIRLIEKQRRDPATKQVNPGGGGYQLGGSMTKVTTNGQCTVSAAKAIFTPTAELPRLLDEQKLKPDQLSLWRAYLSHIEVPAAAGLWYIYDRLPALEQSMVGKECGAATKVGAAGIAQIQADQAEFQRKFIAAHSAPAPVPPAKK